MCLTYCFFVRNIMPHEYYLRCVYKQFIYIIFRKIIFIRQVRSVASQETRVWLHRQRRCFSLFAQKNIYLHVFVEVCKHTVYVYKKLLPCLNFHWHLFVEFFTAMTDPAAEVCQWWVMFAQTMLCTLSRGVTVSAGSNIYICIWIYVRIMFLTLFFLYLVNVYNLHHAHH